MGQKIEYLQAECGDRTWRLKEIFSTLCDLRLREEVTAKRFAESPI
jgi:hypothetical protein